MRYLNFAVTILAVLFASSAFAQQVKLVNSTEQDWAGGIAGHTGSNYTFTVEFTGYDKDPIPKSIWIGSEEFPINTVDSITQANTRIMRLAKGKKLRIDIAVGTFHDEYANRYQPIQNEQQIKAQPKPPVQFKGKALLVYEYEGTIKYLEIKKIMEMKPSMDLP